MSLLVPVLVAVIVLLALFVIIQFNKLVRLRLHIRESWSNVDTELKRRHDLVPNLVSAVQGYARHEREVLSEVTRLRNQALVHRQDTHERREDEQLLARALGRLLAVAENYPQLRASTNFLQLQQQLVETEDRIQAARRFYNGNVRDYNNQVQQFPSNLVARLFGHHVREYFELPSVGERVAPAVQV